MRHAVRQRGVEPRAARPGTGWRLLGALSGLDVELAAIDLATVERGNRLGRGAFGGDVDKPIAQARPGRRVAGDRGGQHNAERIERLGQPLIGKIRRQIADEHIALVVTHPHDIRVSRHPRWFFGKLRRRVRRVNSRTRYGTAMLQCNDSGAGIAPGPPGESASPGQPEECEIIPYNLVANPAQNRWRASPWPPLNQSLTDIPA